MIVAIFIKLKELLPAVAGVMDDYISEPVKLKELRAVLEFYVSFTDRLTKSNIYS